MSRKNYHKNLAEERKKGMMPGMLREARKVKSVSRPMHKPKGLRKVMKSEKMQDKSFMSKHKEMRHG